MSEALDQEATSAAIAAAVRAGTISARDVIEASLARIDALNGHYNAFTKVARERALSTAASIDTARAAGKELGSLAGVPFAVKNLFDLEGVVTLAGSKINRDNAPAAQDAPLIARLETAGAVCVGALNMGEYAYDFTGENLHDGPSRNPHDPTCMTGGSSGGSGAAVAAGMVPLALGSDTNGSIRVPSAFCGLFGLKPTYGRLPRTATFPFCDSLDHLGPMARSTADLALAYDAMQGWHAGDPACVDRPPTLVTASLSSGMPGLRVARLGGYFRGQGDAGTDTAADRCAAALGAGDEIEIAEAAEARAAAFVITNVEGAALHLESVRARADDFDPAVRDRLIAGALMPGIHYVRAQRFRRAFQERLRQVFATVDILVAPTTPMAAPPIGQQTWLINGEEVPLRPNIGIYTQPISFIGLPVVAVPVHQEGAMPLGVQLIAPAWREDLALQAAAFLEAAGIATAPVAAGAKR